MSNDEIQKSLIRIDKQLQEIHKFISERMRIMIGDPTQGLALHALNDVDIKLAVIVEELAPLLKDRTWQQINLDLGAVNE